VSLLFSLKKPMLNVLLFLSFSGDAAQRVDSKNADLRACTPRSKHSATEQRRRSKINDRFQMLRDLVPHSDQKRDKASFLLEVIHELTNAMDHTVCNLYVGFYERSVFLPSM